MVALLPPCRKQPGLHLRRSPVISDALDVGSSATPAQAGEVDQSEVLPRDRHSQMGFRREDEGPTRAADHAEPGGCTFVDQTTRVGSWQKLAVGPGAAGVLAQAGSLAGRAQI